MFEPGERMGIVIKRWADDDEGPSHDRSSDDLLRVRRILSDFPMLRVAISACIKRSDGELANLATVALRMLRDVYETVNRKSVEESDSK